VKAIRIGVKGFAEQRILARISAILLRSHGFAVSEQHDLTTRVIRPALENGHIDLCWEYTGTALVVHHGTPALKDPAAAYAAIRQLDAARGLLWLAPSPLNSSYTLMLRRPDSERLGIRLISDLAAHVRQSPDDLFFAIDGEFDTRPEGLSMLQQAYGFAVPPDRVVYLNRSDIYAAVRDSSVDVAMGYATDGRIPAYGLVNLVDDRDFFPVYTAAPVLRQEVADRHPELVEPLNRLTPHLTETAVLRLTYLVEVEGREIDAVARQWLEESELLNKYKTEG